MTPKDYISMAVGACVLAGGLIVFGGLPNRVDKMEEQLKRLEVLVRQEEQIKDLRRDFEEYKTLTRDTHVNMWRRMSQIAEGITE